MWGDIALVCGSFPFPSVGDRSWAAGSGQKPMEKEILGSACAPAGAQG